MNSVRLAVLLLGLIAPLFVKAEVYKCSVNGKTLYQQSPCAGDGKALALTRESEEQRLDRQQESMTAAQRRLALENMAKDVDERHAKHINAQMEMLRKQGAAREAMDYHEKRAEELRVLEQESKDRDQYTEVWSRNHALEHEKAANALK